MAILSLFQQKINQAKRTINQAPKRVNTLLKPFIPAPPPPKPRIPAPLVQKIRQPAPPPVQKIAPPIAPRPVAQQPRIPMPTTKPQLNVAPRVAAPSARITPQVQQRVNTNVSKAIASPTGQKVVQAARTVQRKANPIQIVQDFKTSMDQTRTTDQRVIDIYKKRFGRNMSPTALNVYNQFGAASLDIDSKKRDPKLWNKLSDEEKSFLESYAEQSKENLQNLAIGAGHGGNFGRINSKGKIAGLDQSQTTPQRVEELGTPPQSQSQTMTQSGTRVQGITSEGPTLLPIRGEIPPTIFPGTGKEAVVTRSSDISLADNVKFPQNPQELNVNRLGMDVEGKARVRSVEGTEIREVLGDKTVKDIASRAGLDTKTFTIDQTANKIAEQLNVRRNIVTLESQFKKAKEAGASPEQLDGILSQIAETSRISRTQGTDIARQLSARRIIANELDTPMQRIFKLLDEAGVNPEVYTKKARTVDFDNPRSVIDFYRDLVPPKFYEWIDVLRYNSMLSSPLTHIVNMASNTFNVAALAPLEKSVTGVVDLFASKVTGKPRQNFIGEGPAYTKGAAQNIGVAAQRFTDVIANKSLYQNLDLKRIPLSHKGVKGKAAAILEVPMKFLEAADQFATALAEGGELGALAYKQSKGGKVTGDIATIAKDKALYRLFKQDLGHAGQGEVLDFVDQFANKIQELKNSKNSLASTVAKFTFPFIATPTNIVKQGIEYSPLGITTVVGAVNKQEQIAKAIIGTTSTMVASMLLGSGRLTWAEPTDPKKKDAFKAAGLQPYGVKIGDNWVSYSKLPPAIGFNLALVAALDDALKNQKLSQNWVDTILGTVAKAGNYYSDQSYFKNLGDLVTSLKGDPEAYARAVSNYPQQLVPFRALSGWLARMFDEHQRKIDPDKGFIEKQVQQLMLNIPGLSQNVPARTGPDGKPLPSQNRIINAFSPVRITTEDKKGAELLKQFETTTKLRSESRTASEENTAKAQSMYEEWKKLSPADANKRAAILKDSHPEIYKALEKVINDAGLTPAEKDLKSLGVENGDRASFIYNKAKSFESKEERNTYINNLREKGVITDDVFDQIKGLRETDDKPDEVSQAPAEDNVLSALYNKLPAIVPEAAAATKTSESGFLTSKETFTYDEKDKASQKAGQYLDKNAPKIKYPEVRTKTGLLDPFVSSHNELSDDDKQVMTRILRNVPEKSRSSAEKYIPAIIKAFKDQGIKDPRVIAYALATIQHETAGTFAPIEEYGGRGQARKLGYDGGENYFGRGFIQLTHLYNYMRYGKKIGLGDKLAKNPELALDPTISAKILVEYFKERGTAKLASEGKFVAARGTVNPDAKGKDLERIANGYLRSLTSK